MKNVKEILVSTLALCVIAACVTGALAATNALTKDTIAARTEEIENAARTEVIVADEFEKHTHDDFTYYTAVKDGAEVGFVFTTVGTGKSSGLTVMVGISNVGNITGVKITADNETAGYTDKVEKGGLLDSFKGKPAKTMTLGTDVDAVSQATKTSKGVLSAVNQAIEQFEAIGGARKNGQ